jgi:superoxide dismutase, Cu-Zn family
VSRAQTRIAVAVAGLAAGAGLHFQAMSAHAANGARKAELRDASGAVVGSVKFQNAQGGNVHVTISIESATPGFHGIHIHANDNPANGDGCIGPSFASADGHYSKVPGAIHGAHTGDLPNVLVTPDGTGSLSTVTDRFELDELPGRAVILHFGVDNHANVPTAGTPNDYTPNSAGATALTASTGNAGGRAACGVIE